MPFKRWVKKSAEVLPGSGIYPVLKRNKLSSHEKTWKPKCIQLSDRSPSKKAVYCTSSSLGHSGKGHVETEPIQGGQELADAGEEEGGIKRWNEEDF